MPNSKPTKEKAAIGQVLFDNKDFEILRLLQKNGRISVKEIADTIHLSTTPVHERVKRLEQTGVIVGYAARLDAALLGKKLMVICHVSLREHNKVAGTKFIKSIIALPEILECYSISGEFDFMLKVLTSDMESYYDFHVNKLSQVENVGHVKSTFVMGVVKQTHEIL
ncbi:MAG TPA: Lrp/AsnC family transcriptional regulator [Niabella sp.]|nr:Lrp/AsnC family transcriptional regulator [Niabella sp.]HOZ96261.1 Lrp/AsnC family transcriptional regulator [Niabella sp.]HQW14665.1 Lrp/AsnC family transcriptional regulator [Niabella sp.]HQX19804.1 Lrp/AsnC family transcriptional regulator [Niabella sp.]HQX41096.1 Lrp/AsnC family transcriptional regulator [Niabella sp.]